MIANAPEWLRDVVTFKPRPPEPPPRFYESRTRESDLAETTRVCITPGCKHKGNAQPITAFRLSNSGASRGRQCNDCKQAKQRAYEESRRKSKGK